MPAAARLTGVDTSRKRKPHKKSRRGCRNCKLRRVKCDEATPKCKKCIDFGASCNYDSSKRTGDLDMALAGVSVSFDGFSETTVHQAQPTQVSFADYSLPDFLYPDLDFFKDSILQLDKASMDRIDRFQMRTVLSVGTTEASKIFQSKLIPMALSRPYLMHAVQTVTAIEDRHYSNSPAKRSMIEAYHMSHTAAQFNKVLSKPLKESDRDAVWTTAILLGVSAFAYTDASVPAESWPLKPSDPDDLEWLRMTELKHAIYKLTDPLRYGSMFYQLRDEYLTSYLSTIPEYGIEGIPETFVDLCELDASSSITSCPYFHSLHMLSQLLRTEYARVTFIKYLAFIMHMTPEYKRLLGLKDPRALVILAYWYGMVVDAMWWLKRRARLECQAVCLYLEKYHSHDTKIMEMLRYPKVRCGLLYPPSEVYVGMSILR
ncbi:uncharacterized protein BDZ99DRAFT_453585 [Mytilinidion resinicola]|uniref:Zn(2)-C6 fungal-type domain-containing protein n=1 Tax=Mytilinidion resinicola TaxID=574789 RepID=A0A6A6Y3U1_9PEZI|nr:uncharacterized protein BDZ99DRAFT_453585 [Mytilinidion resinicola]KAF2803320.1 hypothetical protein BDZ99DRAFT_453585 [Mytilinidion resinicola]